MFKKIKFRSLLGNSWILLALAVLVAGGLTFLLYKYLTDRETKLKAEMEANAPRASVAVVVPMRDVPAGTPLTSGDFVSREIAPDLVYDDMIRVDDFATYRPSRLVRAVRQGRPLRAGDIDALRGRDFSDILPAGQRALTLDIDMINSTADMLRPGNHVDIYWLGKVSRQGQSGADTSRSAQLVMADVLILATGQDIRPRNAGEARQDANGSPLGSQAGSNFSTVTVQVPVSEAPRFALAQKLGSLRLILRNADDKGTDLPKAINENTLFDQGGTTGPAVEVITGGGGMATTELTPDSAPSAIQGRMPAIAADNDSSRAPPVSSTPSTDATTRPSIRDQANAIAQQLQKAVTSQTSARN